VKTFEYGTKAASLFLEGRRRAGRPAPAVEKAVSRILEAVGKDGDRALLRLTAQHDGVRLTGDRIRVRPSEVRDLAAKADPDLVSALRRMAGRIEAFHRRQLETGFSMRLPDGSTYAELVRPLDSAGLYVPGGAGAYPSSVLMNAIPARVAGVPRVAVATPPRNLEANPAVAAALVVAGVEDEVYRVGGAQAIAALAYGTETVRPVRAIVGPGNAFVACAKRQLRGLVAIDSEAGPSEVAILADGSADPGYVAVDLLAQAEHGSGDESVVLVTTDARLAAEVVRLLGEGVGAVANTAAAKRALASRSAVILVETLDDGVEVMNALAAEHAEILTRGARGIAERVVAGAVFVGPYSPVAVGDYGVGPNHVLPTGGSSRFASPLSVRDFLRRQSLVELSFKGLRRVADDVVRVAVAEGFTAHAQSVLTRLASEADNRGGRGNGGDGEDGVGGRPTKAERAALPRGEKAARLSAASGRAKRPGRKRA
jgi:histidinol dehydrogenase